jgi:hypothetical protein
MSTLDTGQRSTERRKCGFAFQKGRRCGDVITTRSRARVASFMQVPKFPGNSFGKLLLNTTLLSSISQPEISVFRTCGQTDISSESADIVFRVFGMTISDPAGLTRRTLIKTERIRSVFDVN